MLALGLLAPGCAPLETPVPSAGEQPFDEIRALPDASADPAARSVRHVPRSAYKARWFFLAHLAPQRPRRVPSVFDPELVRTLRRLQGDNSLRLLITFADTVRVPRFPRLDAALARSEAHNKRALDSTNRIIGSLRTQRSRQYSADTTALKSHGARIIKTFWIVQACAAEMRADSLRALRVRGTNIVQVRLDRGQVAPDHDHERGNDMDTAITEIGSNPWFTDFGDGLVALLDTGVRSTHRLLNDPSPLCMLADLVSGAGTPLAGTVCSKPGADGSVPGAGDTYPDGHGTSTATVLSGNGVPITPDESSRGWFRGVTRASLDCFQVYGADHHLSAAAAVTGFELALERLDQVLVAEMQENDVPDVGAIEAAADHAHDAGLVVIAAGGNSSFKGLGVPARARRAIGVGASGVQLNPPGYAYAWGPSPDGRPKPDLLAPTGTETAGNKSDDSMRYHTATSGATPYAAGAALLLENWLMRPWPSTPFDPDPGQVHALLILSGEAVGPFGSQTQTGVGRLRMPEGGLMLCGKVSVSKGTRSVDVPIDLPEGGADAISAAIWWPERAVTINGVPQDTHNDVDLEIRTPGLLGRRLAVSDGADGVFERASFSDSDPLKQRLVLRIVPYKIRTAESQVVYWALHAHGATVK